MEINKIENIKRENAITTKSWFTEKINKIDKLLNRPTK